MGFRAGRDRTTARGRSTSKHTGEPARVQRGSTLAHDKEVNGCFMSHSGTDSDCFFVLPQSRWFVLHLLKYAVNAEFVSPSNSSCAMTASSLL